MWNVYIFTCKAVTGRNEETLQFLSRQLLEDTWISMLSCSSQRPAVNVYLTLILPQRNIAYEHHQKIQKVKQIIMRQWFGKNCEEKSLL